MRAQALFLAMPIVVLCAACPQQPEPAAEQPAAEQPAPEQPAAEQPAAEQPAAEQPAADNTNLPAKRLDVDPALATAINAFGFDLWGRMRTTPGNLAVSPMSVSLALAMTYDGARSETATQMAKVLHFDMPTDALHAAAGRLVASANEPSGGATVKVANRLFGDKAYTFEDPFLAVTRDRYGAELERVDFQGALDQSRAQINAWVSDRTQKRITDVLPATSLSTDTRLVLVNALYLKGQWVNPFDRFVTSLQPFHMNATQTVSVPTMEQTSSFRYAEQEGLRAVEMAYVGEDLAMTILVPTAADGLAALETSLTAERFGQIRAAMESQQVQLAMPRFVIDPSSSFLLSEQLTAMGMPLAFDRNRADFTGMANPPDPEQRLYIAQVYHKVFVAVDEAGTEAAAATAVEMAVRGMASTPVEVRADHPFLFVIHARESGAILFIGRVADPTPATRAPG
jgi:serpin B